MKKGFTLIELLIVIAIIIILAAVITPVMGKQVRKARDARAVAVAGALRTEISLATVELGGYAPTASSGTTLTSLESGGLLGGSGTTDTYTVEGLSTASQSILAVSGTTGYTVTTGTPSTILLTYSITGTATGTFTFASSNDTDGNSWATK